MNTRAVTTPVVIAWAVIVLVVTTLSVACGFGSSDAQKVAEDFTSALNARAVPTAAGLTTAQPDAEQAMTDIFEALGPDSHFEVTDVDDESNHVSITVAARWKLGEDPAKVDWRYETHAEVIDTGQGWKVRWDPSVLVPQLAAGGSVAFSRVYPEPAAVLDRADKPILTEQVVTRVLVSQGADVDAVAALLSGIDSDITAASLAADLTAAKGKPITAILLRPADLAPISKSLKAIRGVVLQPESKLLFSDRELASPALNGLTEVWTAQRDAAAGWTVEVTDAEGTVHALSLIHI